MNMSPLLVYNAFMDADKDKKGYLNIYELEDSLLIMGKDLKLPYIKHNELDRYLLELGLDDHGIITIDEFKQLFYKIYAEKGKNNGISKKKLLSNIKPNNQLIKIYH